MTAEQEESGKDSKIQRRWNATSGFGLNFRCDHQLLAAELLFLLLSSEWSFVRK